MIEHGIEQDLVILLALIEEGAQPAPEDKSNGLRSVDHQARQAVSGKALEALKQAPKARVDPAARLPACSR
jgi:hypothetical protein